MYDWLSQYFDWQVRYDYDEAVFRRPIGTRIFMSLPTLIAVGMCLFYVFVAFTGSPHRHELLKGALVYFIIAMIFATGTGPKVMRFDFRQKRYTYQFGFPFLTWTRSGDFSEISHLAVWNQRFTGLTVEWKDRKRIQTTFVSCGSKLEAQILGDKLGCSLCVPLEDGLVLGFIKNPK